MKKITILGISIAIALGFVGCKKDNLSNEVPLKSEKSGELIQETFSVAMVREGTKTSIEEGGKVNWVKGDKIYYYTSDEGELREFVIPESGPTATLLLERAKEDTYFNIIYAGGEEPKLTKHTSNSLIFDAVKTSQKATFANANISVGRAVPGGSSVTLKPIIPIVKVTTTRTDVKSIVLKGGAGTESVAGEISVDPSAAAPVATVTGSGTNEVVATVATPAAGTYYINALPGTYSNGVKLSLKNAAGVVVEELVASKSISLSASGTIENLGDAEEHGKINIAAIGTVGYATLADAFKAADEAVATGQTAKIDMLQDYTTSETNLSISENHIGVTLNLNGKTITFNAPESEDLIGLIKVSGSSKFSVVDLSEKPGSIIVSSGDNVALFDISDSGNVQFDNIAVVHNVSGRIFNMVGGALSLRGGTLTKSGSGNILRNDGGLMTCENATFTSVGSTSPMFSTVASGTSTFVSGTYKIDGKANIIHSKEAAVVEIKGGDFESTEDPSNKAAISFNGASSTISGGKFTELGNGNLIVTDGGIVQIQGGTFESSSSAQLLRVGKETKSLSISGGKFTANKGSIAKVDTCPLEITDGTFSYSTKDASVKMFEFEETVTSIIIRGGSFIGKGKSAFAYFGSGAVEISGGHFETYADANIFICTTANSINVSGGEFIRNSTGTVLNFKYGKNSITGGYFYHTPNGTDGLVSGDASVGIVSGGYFNDDYGLDKKCADGFTVNKLSKPEVYNEKEYNFKVFSKEISFPKDAIHGVFSVSPTKTVCFAKGNSYLVFKDGSYVDTCLENNQYSYQNQFDIAHTGLFYWTTQNYFGALEEFEAQEGVESIDWGAAYCQERKIPEDTWTVLTAEEWEYLLVTRGRGNAYYSKDVTVGDCKGCLVIAPDGNTVPIKSYYSFEEWAVWENMGFVCLPPAGTRQGKEIKDVGFSGSYWTSTKDKTDPTCTFSVNFSLTDVISIVANAQDVARSVRFVSVLD